MNRPDSAQFGLLFTLHTIVTLLGFAVLFVLGHTRSGFSFFCGSAIMGANLGLLYFLWNWRVYKKNIALRIVLIVFKYTLLFAGSYWLVQTQMVETVWFALGFTSLAFTALFWAVSVSMRSTQSKEDGKG